MFSSLDQTLEQFKFDRLHHSCSFSHFLNPPTHLLFLFLLGVTALLSEQKHKVNHWSVLPTHT